MANKLDPQISPKKARRALIQPPDLLKHFSGDPPWWKLAALIVLMAPAIIWAFKG